MRTICDQETHMFPPLCMRGNPDEIVPQILLRDTETQRCRQRADLGHLTRPGPSAHKFASEVHKRSSRSSEVNARRTQFSSRREDHTAHEVPGWLEPPRRKEVASPNRA